MSFSRASQLVRAANAPLRSPGLFSLQPQFRTRPQLASSSRYATSLAQEPHASSLEAVRIMMPTPKDLEAIDQDPDVLVNESEANIVITPRAAEQLRNISTRDNDPNVALRIAVESGGCHGYQYKMELTSQRETDDYVFTHPTLKPSNVLIDAVSLGLLKGSTVDFATELIGSSFRVVNNPQAKGAGCGCGVSWEAKF